MKKKIYGRKVGSKGDMTLLIAGDGVSTGGRKADQSTLDEFSVASTRRAVEGLRERGIEGYVMFEGDPTRYGFTPEADFVYPAAVHHQIDAVTMTDNIAAARRWREQWGYISRGGVVVLLNGEVQSWVNELRNPEHWQPGCIAVDETGRSWTALAGNAKDGALMWLPNDPISD